MNSTILVGNMSAGTTEADLRDTFGRFGSVMEVCMVKGRMTGLPQGVAVVTFSAEKESQSAAAEMNGMTLDGRDLEVSQTPPNDQACPLQLLDGNRPIGIGSGAKFNDRGIPR